MTANAFNSPHSMRAIQQAFDAGDEPLGYRLMEENQQAVEDRTVRAYRDFQDLVTATPGTEIVLGSFANVPNAYMAVKHFFTFSATLGSGTLSYDPTPDFHVLGASTPAATTGERVMWWKGSQHINIVLNSGWARADAGSGTVDIGTVTFAWALEGKGDAV